MKRIVPLLVPLLLAGCGESQRTEPIPQPVVEMVERGDLVENPAYSKWAAFPVGTEIVQRSVTEELGHPDKTTTIITFKLVEKTDERISLEIKTRTVRYDGLVLDNPPDRLSTDRWFRLPPNAKKPVPRSSAVEEKLTVSKRTYQTRVFESHDRNEGGDVRVTTWTSDGMPGGLVKSISDTPAVKKRTTIEVTDVRLP